MKEKFRKVNLSGSVSITMDEKKGVWNAKKSTVISNMMAICEEYIADGYSLTLRQLYYQLVARDIIPNHDKVYKKISGLKDEAVYGGLIDWGVFEDRGRVPFTPYSEDSIKGALEKTVDYYRLDRQKTQKNHIEVWTEKDAISSILKRVTNKYGVTLVVNKGYTSSTAIYGAYERFSDIINEGGKVKILYFGDHDPSGLDMIRDINDRLLFMFTNGVGLYDFDERVDEWWNREGLTLYDVANMDEKYESVALLMGDLSSKKEDKIYDLFEQGRKLMYFKEKELFEVLQVGLTMEQIKEYNPPSNPAKMTDPRMRDYISKYGKVSWEVDALKPKIMEGIVKNAIEESIDMDAYEDIMEKERLEKKKIKEIIKDLKE
jgi:DNA topoisomerase VI subunit A